MGSSVPPKAGWPSVPFGSSSSNAITQVKDAPTISGPGLAADSGYNMTAATPATPPPVMQGGGLGGSDIDELRKRLQELRTGNGGRPMPFFG